MKQAGRYPRVVYNHEKTAKLQSLPVFPMLELVREWIEDLSLTRNIFPREYICHFADRVGNYDCEYHIDHTERLCLLFHFKLDHSRFSGHVELRKVLIQRLSDSPATKWLVPEGVTYTFDETGVTSVYYYCEKQYFGDGLRTLVTTLVRKWPKASKEYDSPEIQQMSSKQPTVLAERCFTDSKPTASEEQQQQQQLPKVAIFLDIDGVLYLGSDKIRKQVSDEAQAKFNVESPSNNQCSQVAVSYFSKKALTNLHQLLQTDKWQVDVVISSSWKDNRTTEQLKQLFSQHEFSYYIVDRICDDRSVELQKWAQTKQLERNRGAQIAMWLDQHRRCYQSFVILDDVNYWFDEIFPLNFVQVNARDLLTEQDCKKASEILEQHQQSPWVI